MLELESSLAVLDAQHASVAEASLSQGTEVRAAPDPPSRDTTAIAAMLRLSDVWPHPCG